MAVLVFLPATAEEAVRLRAGADLGVRTGCAATPSLHAAAGTDASTEEVEYAALSYAGDLARAGDPTGRPLVLAVDAESDQVTDDRSDGGEVQLARVSWAQVRSLFAGEPGEPDDADLLWYSVDELDQLSRSRPGADEH